MVSMVEKVAEAIAGELWKRGIGTNAINDIAKAAIQAMREPTDEMLDAGAYDLDMTLKTQYENMIDAALKE